MWDNLTCWHPAQIGEVVEVNCPELFSQFMSEEEYGQCQRAFWCRMHPLLLTIITVLVCVHCEKPGVNNWLPGLFQFLYFLTQIHVAGIVLWFLC